MVDELVVVTRGRRGGKTAASLMSGGIVQHFGVSVLRSSDIPEGATRRSEALREAGEFWLLFWDRFDHLGIDMEEWMPA